MERAKKGLPAGVALARALEADSAAPGSVEPGSVDTDCVNTDSVEPAPVEPGSVEPGSVEPASVELGSWVRSNCRSRQVCCQRASISWGL